MDFVYYDDIVELDDETVESLPDIIRNAPRGEATEESVIKWHGTADNSIATSAEIGSAARTVISGRTAAIRA